MVRVGVVLALCVMSAFVPSVPAGTTVAMVVAAVVGLAAFRFHTTADVLALGDDAVATPIRRVARFCDDLALALCVLALLYAVHPF